MGCLELQILSSIPSPRSPVLGATIVRSSTAKVLFQNRTFPFSLLRVSDISYFHIGLSVRLRPPSRVGRSSFTPGLGLQRPVRVTSLRTTPTAVNGRNPRDGLRSSVQRSFAIGAYPDDSSGPGFPNPPHSSYGLGHYAKAVWNCRYIPRVVSLYFRRVRRRSRDTFGDG